MYIIYIGASKISNNQKVTAPPGNCSEFLPSKLISNFAT